MEILYSFIGCMVAILVTNYRRRTDTPKFTIKKKEAKENFSDVLGAYKKDKISKLYETYVPKKTRRDR